jgi:hypothetical protein
MKKSFLPAALLIAAVGAALAYGGYKVYADYLESHKDNSVDSPPEISNGEILFAEAKSGDRIYVFVQGVDYEGEKAAKRLEELKESFPALYGFEPSESLGLDSASLFEHYSFAKLVDFSKPPAPAKKTASDAGNDYKVFDLFDETFVSGYDLLFEKEGETDSKMCQVSLNDSATFKQMYAEYKIDNTSDLFDELYLLPSGNAGGKAHYVGIKFIDPIEYYNYQSLQPGYADNFDDYKAAFDSVFVTVSATEAEIESGEILEGITLVK